jgi:hypothetical protein
MSAERVRDNMEERGGIKESYVPVGAGWGGTPGSNRDRFAASDVGSA